MDVKNASKEDITKQVRIIDLCEEFGINVESISSGNFDCRCICPSKNHKNGGEKTPSLYIDSENNNYYCYGCASSHNCIDFYMICADVTFSDAIAELRKRASATTKSVRIEAVEDSLPILLEMSSVFREAMNQHKNDLKWINTLMKKTDEYLEDIDRKDTKKANLLLKGVLSKIKERYSS